MRSIRKQPFCWQEKSVLRLLRKIYEKSELIKMRCLYGAITEMDSDFNERDIKYYTKTIYAYSGLSKDWIPQGLKNLEKLGILKIVEERVKGQFKGKRLIFTGFLPQKTVPGKTLNGKSFNGRSGTSEDSTSLEDINSLEDTSSYDLEETKSSNPPKKLNSKITPKQFDDFWALYPKRTGGQGSKGTAKTKWDKLCRNKNEDSPTWRQIKGAIIRQMKSEQWQNTKYIPMSTTWLNNKRWLDDAKELRTFVPNAPEKKLGPDEDPNFYADGKYAKPKPGKYAKVPVIQYDSAKGVLHES